MSQMLPLVGLGLGEPQGRSLGPCATALHWGAPPAAPASGAGAGPFPCPSRQPDDTACIYLRGYGFFDCRNFSTVEDTYYFHFYSENLEALRRIVPHPREHEATTLAQRV